MSKKKNAGKEFNDLPEEKITPPEPVTPEKTRQQKLKAAIEEIKDLYGLDVEPKRNIAYKLGLVEHYLQEKYDFRYNVINTDVEYKLKESKEYQYFDARSYRIVKMDVKKNGNLSISDDDFKSMVYGELAEPYNPFHEYLIDPGLPKWDGKTDYIRQYLEQVMLKDEENRPYFVEGFKKWFVALVMSLIVDIPDQYYVNQVCLVLVGGQGKFKTTWLKRIVPDRMQMNYYYGSYFNMHNKDHEKYLAYKILIALDEMGGLLNNKTDMETAKSKITQHQVVVRLPYEPTDIKLKRRASFCGSVNKKEWLNDDTGDRRWFTVEIDRIDLDEGFNVDNMYSQALELYRNGYKYWFDSEDMFAVQLQNEKFRFKGMEEAMIVKHYQVPTEEDYEKKIVKFKSATDIAMDLAGRYNRINVNNTIIKAIGSALSKHGFKKTTRYLSSKQRVPLWGIVEVDITRDYDTEAGSISGKDETLAF